MPVQMETRERDTKESPSETCKLCLKNQSKYTCPRCNIQYCSTDCYKCTAHAQCSENFYKDCFMEGLQDLRSSDEDKRKVTEMLKRLEEQNPELDSDDDDDDDQEGDLSERLAGVNLDDTGDVWRSLSERERREFSAMLEDGRLGNLVELWQPWWFRDHKLVEELDTSSAAPVTSATGPVTTPIPTINRDIPPIDTLLKNKPPAASLPYTVLNVLYGYAFTCRLHNGEHHQTPIDATRVVVQTSEALGARVFTSTADSIHGCLSCVQAKSSNTNREFQIAVLNDLKTILAGPSRSSPLQYVMAALSDLHKLFVIAKKSAKSADSPSSESDADKFSYTKYKKKVEFLLSWSHKYGLRLSGTTAELELEICTLTSELARHDRDKQQFEKRWGGKIPPKPMQRFVEEIQ